MNRKIFFTILIVVFAQLLSCNSYNPDSTEKEIKYVFYFIGDGMGLAQSHAAELYLASKNKSSELGFLNMNRLPHHSYFTTHASNRYITGSAASVTAMSSGIKTTISTLGLNANRSLPTIPITQKAKEKGMKIGIITDVSIDHATPAGFYAHQVNRNMYYQIGLDLINSDFDFFGGGGFIYPDGHNENADTNLIEYAIESGYNYVNSKQELQNLNSSSGKILAVNENLDVSSAMPYSIDKQDNDFSLKELLSKAIEILDNENGFFIMLEGGKIDWLCHMNDAASCIKDVIAFDDAIGVAMDFYEKHPDETVIIVAADHETGGLSIGSVLTEYQINYTLIDYQKASMEEMIKEYTQLENPGFNKALEYIQENLGLNGPATALKLTDYDLRRLKKAYKNQDIDQGILNNPELFEAYGGYHPFITTAIKIFNQKAGIGFTSWAHTGIPVPLRYAGLDPAAFTGLTDNTDLPKQIEKALGINE